MLALGNVIGNIGRIEYKTSKGGNMYVEFSLANNRGFGEKQETDWYHCVAFDKVAERLQKAGVEKGSFVQVIGTQALEKFERKDGSKGLDVKITVLDWAYIPAGSGKKTGEHKQAAPETGGAPDLANSSAGDFCDIDDDGDLPF